MKMLKTNEQQLHIANLTKIYKLKNFLILNYFAINK